MLYYIMLYYIMFCYVMLCAILYYIILPAGKLTLDRENSQFLVETSLSTLVCQGLC